MTAADIPTFDTEERATTPLPLGTRHLVDDGRHVIVADPERARVSVETEPDGSGRVTIRALDGETHARLLDDSSGEPWRIVIDDDTDGRLILVRRCHPSRIVCHRDGRSALVDTATAGRVHALLELGYHVTDACEADPGHHGLTRIDFVTSDEADRFDAALPELAHSYADDRSVFFEDSAELDDLDLRPALPGLNAARIGLLAHGLAILDALDEAGLPISPEVIEVYFLDDDGYGMEGHFSLLYATDRVRADAVTTWLSARRGIDEHVTARSLTLALEHRRGLAATRAEHDTPETS